MKIMAAIDFSLASEKVMQAAKAYATALQASVYLIHVEALDPDRLAIESEALNEEQTLNTRPEEIRLKKDARAMETAGMKVTPLLLQGPVTDTILAEAERLKIDLILVGSHGHRALRHMLVGSISEGILRKAEVPVMIVPARP